jgi:hypothetical protein
MAKKILNLIVILLFVQNSSLLSQNMLQPGNQWIFEYNEGLFHLGQTIETIIVGVDTVINQTHYSKVTASKTFPCEIFSSTEFLREEGNKIFRLSMNRDQEFLMIDFGETVSYQMLYELYPGEIDTGLVLIDSFGIEFSADSTPIEVQYLKIINNQSYDDSAQYIVYRDIGFIQGGFLFPDLGTGLCDPFDWIRHRCYISETDTIHFTQYDCYESSIDKIEYAYVHEISLYPNPVTDKIFIPAGLVLIDLTDMNGKVMIQDHDESSIYISNLASGLYLVRFLSVDRKEIYIGKFVKA